MKTIYTHPDNVQPLLASLRAEAAKSRKPVEARGGGLGWGFGPILDLDAYFDVRPTPHLERTRPSGKIIAPDGRVSDRAGWTYRWDRFTTLEESDLPWLIALGVVQQEQEMLFYEVDDSLLRLYMDLGPTIRVPRYAITSCTV